MVRVERLRALMEERGVEAMLIQKAENRRHLTGFTGSAGVVLVTPREALLLVDFRYVEQAGVEASGFEVIKADRQFIDTLVEVVAARGLRRIGFESDGLTYKQYDDFSRRLAPASLVPIDGVDRLRWVKDREEIERITRAVEIADRAFAHIRGMLRPGAVERDLAIEMEFFMRRQGAEKEAFETIVASGPRSALPHGRASDRALGAGEFVTLDFGAMVDGYVSDCTRTVVLGETTPRHEEIYGIVLRAQQEALAGLRPGMTGREADALARNVIAASGYGEAFGHSLGHGVGLAVHEGPTLSPREEAVLSPGMVVTVEPGIYLPGWGGVRIEDLVVITADGCRVLTRAPKELSVP
ncbi:MAG: Xaa-Pro peptidase family protein [Armatimonadota bacterium]|nr:Xaa-Pro peptidase family protein [Armatimonadota bacterium]MDR7450388.1 Xaa-Pro peptidase family protein [Armatimonadota bacterium]MDR7467029.1 Xaa-Pro peptidase family protein [Armatimonadota bacterium]MDR7493429.1 Xaa-Pro peptidase family protein [Armatimonadota bacterium]MDR7498694.1 Xaa-Pro peptidase family protein [Armatimonadota bacterium]